MIIMAKSINELYNIQKEIWKDQNEYFFGLTPLDDWSNLQIVEKHLNNCVDKFWNNGTNETKKLLENGKCKDIDKLVPDSYELLFDHIHGLICLYGTFEFEKSSKNNEKIIERKRSPLVYFPYANDLCWFLGESEYVLRISATINYSLITRHKNICKYQKTWTYDIDNDEFNIVIDDFDPFEKLTNANKIFLQHCYGEEITKENFKDALKSIPEFDSKSILYFRFEHVSEMFKLVTRSSRFANPLMRVPIPINIVKMFSRQKSIDDARDNGSFNNLILSNNKLFALENSRTIIYKSQFNASFNFSDSEKLFDAFKTSTNKSAGRSRLLLDDVVVKDQILWKKIDNENGEEIYKNMYELILNDDIKVNNNLSILSCSRFSYNNDPKRIMMTAKLRAQAIPVEGEVDQFTHEVPARIVFGDFEGFNFGDSIIISKSFAKKLESNKTLKRRITKEEYDYLSQKYKIGDELLISDFNKIMESYMYNNYRDIILKELDKEFIVVTAKLPFSIGDKITNFHGSKGIVSLIFEDEDMPYLKNDLSENFKAGPFDVIVSGLSVYRRKSLGQIFEAWSLASGYDNVNNIQDAVKYYKEEMKDFSNKSIVCFNGVEVVKPCGINMMIRLNHDAVAQQSRSYLKSNYGKMLKFGEMELLNLAARGLFDVMNELDIRSVSKHYNSFGQIKEMQKTGKMKYEPSNNLRFFNILQTIGFDFNLRKLKSNNENNKEFEKIQTVLTDKMINLFDDREE